MNTGRLLFAVLLLFFLILSFDARRAAAQKVEIEPESNIRQDIYFTLEEALNKLFPEADEIKQEVLHLSDEARKRVEQAVGHALAEQEFIVYQGFKSGKLMGYAVVGEEIGKFRPITSMVLIAPDGKVKDIEIMVYRESHGADIRRKRFLRQYKGKSIRDPVRINRDITSISGATISVHSMNAQVRKVVHVIHEAYFRPADESI